MKLQVTIKNVYGNETIYPACEQSKLLAKLAGHKTLTRYDIELIKALGYTVEVITNNVTTL